jgi:hypothetical protein
MSFSLAIYRNEHSSHPRGQSFGEISSIARRANGDIMVDFRKAEVADTVRTIGPLILVSLPTRVCRCAVFKPVFASLELGAVPSRGIS